MTHPHDENPINPLPPVVIALSVFLVGVELVFVAGNSGLIGGPEAAGWRITMIENWGFREPLFAWMIENGRFLPGELVRFVTYPFLHLSFTHLLFVLVFLLALGKMVGEVFSAFAFLVVFFGSAIAGALAYWLVWDTGVVLFGGYPAVYGLIGAYTFILWAELGARGASQVSAFRLIAFLLGIQLIFSLLFGAGLNWVSEVAGFVSGFGLSFLVSPGGWARVVQRLRQR
ncbi:Rhomboid family protein [Aliiroseovarius halocynthiae]|uniref:Rhomboid family intramembrane serine protease n=1 Tax=Aliiroseovarius halocynthiae TaxID=985055 RepID=A0A545SRH8_9RHOB|nr:rhomboid family intramembrane serine protease [Aliiroseovarius halocynthiae]TQV67581.1 rhomboid family intramembrane serine protease [Aliiroseovarius halocynthiae]SMR81597.1 Rhomboid family protein [Aliiroseovarius halocynthiae]